MTLALVLATCTMALAQQGRLKGKITDDSGEPVPFANVIIEKGGSQMGGASSDFDGNYDINPIPPGTYTLKASCVGYNAYQVNNIVIPANKITYYDIKMTQGIKLDDVVIVDYTIPLISKDNTVAGESVTAEEIAKLPVRSADGVAASVGGVFSADGEVGSIRGSREGAVYYIDGVRVIGNGSVPQGAIDQVDVILGGTPAQYGDAAGGIINMTTKGPSRTWGGGVEYEHSVDGYGHKRLGFSVNGPLLKQRAQEGEQEREALLGFFIAGDLAHNRVGSIAAPGYWHATDEWMDYIKANPLTLGGTGTGANAMASYTQRDNLYHTRFLNNSSNWSVNLNGKFDIRTGPTTNLTIGGSFYRGQSHGSGRAHYFFNTDKNYLHKSGTYRGYIRFSQRFPTDPESTSVISNVYYSIQADYTHTFAQQGDPDLWDNIFAYGNIGKFTTHRAPNYEFVATPIDSVLVDGEYHSFSNVWVLNNFYDTLVEFERMNYDFNPLLANYVENYFDLYEPYGAFGNYNNMSNIVGNKGLINGRTPGAAYGMYAVPGTIMTSYAKSATDQVAFNINGSLTIGKGDNSHEIKLGLQAEMRNAAYMGYSGSAYWTLMRDLTNYHIQELDKSSPYAISHDGFVDTINYHRMYDPNMQYTFDVNLRKALGLSPTGTEWILIDSYDFNDNSIKYYDEEGNLKKATLNGGFDLSMFSADELTRDGDFYVDYYGYTYDGHRKYGLFERPTLDDFFNNTDSNGNFTREIGAQQPIYLAGYIQDKFAFKDLIFNIGVRVDRFDANQKVLRDPYVLYDFHTVGDLINNGRIKMQDDSWVDVPDNIGDNFVPYVNKIEEMTEIVGYRNGNTWYNAEGKEITDPEALDMGTGVSPWITDPSQSQVDIKSFKDYDPAWSVMPRISFSFPISDEALFYAHYDMLTQRPTGSAYCSPLVYLHFNEYGETVDNPDLQPSQTIDYELGFKQKLTNTSSLTITAYYRELRNMIQMYRFNGAYPKAYNGFSNLDFGTVKGMTASYDLRRTKNVRVRASYTLQFDNKTGASATTASALIAAGVPNLRSTYPSNSDRRHNFNLTLDYRFKGGKDYNGPVIKREKAGKNPVQVFANTGFALTVNGGSGAPYTAARKVLSPIQQGTSLLQGTYNGSRMPASFRFDLRVDKDINFVLGANESEGKKGREAFVNVYLQVLNLLNSKNILGVYSATGNPDDDGYLSAPEWQREIQEQLDPQAFIQMYQLYVDQGGHYSTPRQIRLGVSFNF